MAITTQAQRWGVLGTRRRVLPFPDGTIALADRYVLLGLYQFGATPGDLLSGVGGFGRFDRLGRRRGRRHG